MSKKPMIPPARDLCPPEAKTPEEQFEHLGRKLFRVTPEQLRLRERLTGAGSTEDHLNSDKSGG